MKKLLVVSCLVFLFVFVTSVSASDIQSMTVGKNYRLKDLTTAGGLWPTRDGGWLMVGNTIWDKAMADEDAFLMKIKSTGVADWSRLWQSKSSTKSQGTGNNGGDYGLAVAELADGSFIMAGQINPGFITDAYLKKKESWGDIFVSKFNNQGKIAWTKMLGDYGLDLPGQLLINNDKSWLLVNSLSQTGFSDDIADQDAVPTYTVLDKYRVDGSRQLLKKINLSQVTLTAVSDGWLGIGNLFQPRPDSIVGLTDVSLFSDLPVVFKIDKNFRLLWAKTIETTPLVVPNVQVNADKTMTMTNLNYHLPASDFRSVVATPDNGCLVVGRLSPSVSTFSSTDSTELLAVKFDPDGNYQWARSLALNKPISDVMFMSTFQAVVTKDNGLALLGEFTKVDSDRDAKFQTYNKKFNDFYSKYKTTPGREEITPASKKDWAQILKLADGLSKTSRPNSLIIKTDLEFSPLWAKAIGNDKAIILQKLSASNDGGLTAVGRYETDVLNNVQSGVKHYFHDAVLIKINPQGEVPGAKGLISNYQLGATTDRSSQVIPLTTQISISDYKYQIDTKPKPSTPNQKVKTGELAPFFTLKSQK